MMTKAQIERWAAEEKQQRDEAAGRLGKFARDLHTNSAPGSRFCDLAADLSALADAYTTGGVFPEVARERVQEARGRALSVGGQRWPHDAAAVLAGTRFR